MRLGVLGARRGLLYADIIRDGGIGIEVVAVADPNPEALTPWRERDHVRLHEEASEVLASPDIDAVYIATPIQTHAALTLRALESGKHVLCEIPACTTIDEGREIVRAVRRSSLTYMLAESYCFIREHRYVLDLCRNGVFGEITYASGTYSHDCKPLMFDPDGLETWRGAFMRANFGNVYPTHSIGPLSQWLGVGPGKDRFSRIVAMQSSSRAVQQFARERFGPLHSAATTPGYLAGGDVTITLIQTERGAALELVYDTLSNRPPLRAGRLLQGTRGFYVSGRIDGEPSLLWLDDLRSQMSRRNAAPLEVPREADPRAARMGDYYAICLLVEEFAAAVAERRDPLISVEDAVSWSSVAELSRESLRSGSSLSVPTL